MTPVLAALRAYHARPVSQNLRALYDAVQAPENRATTAEEEQWLVYLSALLDTVFGPRAKDYDILVLDGELPRIIRSLERLGERRAA